MTTTQPAALPELPHTTYSLFYEQPGDLEDEGYQYVLDEPGYTADQMRAYALATLQAQPAAAGVSDADVWELWLRVCAESDNVSTRVMIANFARAILALRPQAVPMTDADAVQVYGIKNGQQTLLGTAPMPSRMKARELAREQFGHFEDGDGSDAELCFYALEQLIEHMERSAHHGITAQGGEG